MRTPTKVNALVVATPSYSGSVCSEYVGSLLELQKTCIERQITFTQIMLMNVSVVEIARNRLASRFLYETQGSHMLFVDDDMGFGVPELMRMLDYGGEADVVAAMSPRKSINWTHVKDTVLACPNIDPAILAAIAGDYNNMFRFEKEAATMTIGSAPTPVAAIGTGVMLISRHCLLRLIETGRAPGYQRENKNTDGRNVQAQYHEFFRSSSPDGLMGEDYYFCSQVRAYGGTILGCSWIPIVHVGRYAYRGDLPAIADYWPK